MKNTRETYESEMLSPESRALDAHRILYEYGVLFLLAVTTVVTFVCAFNKLNFQING